MQALGATTMLVCSNVAEEAIDDDDLAAEQLHQLADRAADRGLRIAYEALAWGRHVSSTTTAGASCSAPTTPPWASAWTASTSSRAATDLATIAEIPGEKIFFLQLADAPRLRMDVLQWSRHYRCFPGQGGFDLAHFLAAVLDAGYRGPLSLEVFNDVFRQADPDRMAIDAMRSLLLLEEATHARSGHAPARSPALDVSECCPPRPTCTATRSRSWWSTRRSWPDRGAAGRTRVHGRGPPSLQAGDALARGHGQRAGQRDRR